MLPLFLLFVLSVNAATINDDCPYEFDKSIPYQRKSILTIKGLPTNLAINPKTEELFFTLIDLDTLQNDTVQTKMDQYVLRKSEPIKIDNVRGQAAAVDTKNDKVYIASDDGLNVLNETDKANFMSLKDEDIVQLFKPRNTDDLYAVFYPDNDVYVIDVKENEKRKVDNVPCAYILAVDDEENMYFECDSKYVKVLLKGFQEPIEYVGIPKNSARAITVDDHNRVVLAANDGLYHLRPDNMIPKKLMDLDFMASGIVFNGPDFYLATNGIIYKYYLGNCKNTV